MSVGGNDCVVMDPLCSKNFLCDHCEDEIKHRMQIRRERERNEVNRRETEIVVADPVPYIFGMAILGIGTLVTREIREAALHRKQKKAGRL